MIDFITEVQIKMARIALDAAKQSVDRMAESPKGVTWTWDTIKGFGEAKALRTSFLFLFLVPLAARLLANIPDEVTVPIFDKMVEIPLGLPFSWFVLFMSACFASIGNLIYAAFCPELIKKYKDFPAYQVDERDGTYLLPFVKKISFENSSESAKKHLEVVKKLYNNTPIDIHLVESELDGNDRLRPRHFYFVRDSINLAQPLIRLAASVSYFIAFLCLGVIAIQNIVFVIRYVAL